MNLCNVIEWDPDSLSPPVMGRLEPGASEWFAEDWSALDCAGAGVTITDSAWEVHPDDLDADLTIAAEATSGMKTYVRLSAAADMDAKTYHVINTVTTSDGQTIPRIVAVRVQATRLINA